MTAEDSESEKQSPIKVHNILGTTAVQQETLLYVLVSAMDVFMTYILLGHQGGAFFESNPVARYFIHGWGMKGMVYFKFATVAFVCVLAQIIARRRPRIARWLLLGATALVAVVVIYSLKLLLMHGNTTVVEVD